MSQVKVRLKMYMEYICECSIMYIVSWSGLCILVFCPDHDIWTDVEPHPRTSLRTQEPQHWPNCKRDAKYVHNNLLHCVKHYVNDTVKMSVLELYPW